MARCFAAALLGFGGLDGSGVFGGLVLGNGSALTMGKIPNDIFSK